MKDIMGLMKQMGQMQARVQQMQEELDALEIEGRSGAGLVSVFLSGKGDMKRLAIDPSLMRPEETEVLEDLIIAAAADAKSKVEVAMKQKMEEITGGLPIPPGMKLW